MTDIKKKKKEEENKGNFQIVTEWQAQMNCQLNSLWSFTEWYQGIGVHSDHYIIRRSLKRFNILVWK